MNPFWRQLRFDEEIPKRKGIELWSSLNLDLDLDCVTLAAIFSN